MKRRLFLAAACGLALSLFGVGTLLAVPKETYKFSAPAGTSVHELGSHTVRVEASAKVTLYIVFQGEEVTGAVDPTGEPASVTITVITEDSEEVIFDGHVRKITPFEALLPHETGHGEG